MLGRGYSVYGICIRKERDEMKEEKGGLCSWRVEKEGARSDSR